MGSRRRWLKRLVTEVIAAEGLNVRFPYITQLKLDSGNKLVSVEDRC